MKIARVLVYALLGIIGFVIFLAFRVPRCPPMPIAQTRMLCLQHASFITREMGYGTLPWELPETVQNEINITNESLWAWASSKLSEPDRDFPLCDTDGDGRPEYADAYGNPLILLLNSSKVTIKNKEGTEFDIQLEGIEPGKSFALWSMGPNGANKYGLGDDIGWTCWRVEKGKIVEEGVFKAGIEWTKGERPENPLDK